MPGKPPIGFRGSQEAPLIFALTLAMCIVIVIAAIATRYA